MIGKRQILRLPLKSEVESRCELGTINEAGKFNSVMTLEKDKTMALNVRDVLYSRVEQSKVSLKYNTMTNYKMSNKELEDYKRESVGFNKSLVWYYEKETRLLVTLTGEAAKYADEIYSQPDNKLRCMVRVPIDNDTYNNLYVDFAPEIAAINEVFAATKERPGIREFLYKSSRLALSEYAGTVTMNLCSRCRYKRGASSDGKAK